MRRGSLVLAGVVALVLGVAVSALAATSYSAWVKVDGTYSNRCGYVRTHVDSAAQAGFGTIKVVTNSGGCDSSNAAWNVNPGIIEVVASLFNQASGNTFCGSETHGPNTVSTSSLEAEADDIGGVGCALDGGNYKSHVFGEMEKESDGTWPYAEADSQAIPFD